MVVAAAIGSLGPERPAEGARARRGAPAAGAASVRAADRVPDVRDAFSMKTNGHLVDGVVFVPLSNVVPRAVDWLWAGRIPLGKVTLIVGDPGLGKSWLTEDLATRVSRGAAWPDGG